MTKKAYLLLLILTVVTAGGSIAYLTNVARNSNTANARSYPTNLTSTAHDNYVLTKNIAEHNVFSMEEEAPFTPTSWRVPGYPLFALPFYSFFHSFYPILFVQMFLLFLTAILIFKMAFTIMGRNWALALSVLYLLLPDTILAASALTTENLFVFLFTLALYAFFFSEKKNIYLRAVVAGFLLALATYVREASFYLLIFFIPAYFLFYLERQKISRKHFIAAGLLVLVFVGSLMPWFLRNKEVFGVFAFASTSGNVLLRQNGAQFYQSLSGLSAVESRNVLLERAGLATGTVPNDFASSPAMTKVSLELIADHPLRYVIFHASTFIPFFLSSGAHEYWRFVSDMLPDFHPAQEPSLIQALNPLSLPLLITVIKNHGWTLLENGFWLLIVLLAILSLWWSKNPRLARMFMAITLYFAVVTGPIAHARYRIPVEPLLLITAFASAYFLGLRRQWRLEAQL